MKAQTRNILLVISAIVVLFLVWYFKSLVTYLILSAVLATIGRPIVKWLQQIKVWKFRLNVSASAFLTLALMWGVFYAFFRFIIPLVAYEFQDLANVDIDAYLKALETPVNQITQFFYGERISFSDHTFLDLFGTKISKFFEVSQITDLFGTIAGAVGQILVGAFSVSFITFFFLREKGMFKRGLLLLAPREYEERVNKSLNRIDNLLRRYFAGILLEVFMVAALDSLGLYIIGFTFGDSVLIGLICGLLNVIPYLGPWIGAALGVLIGIALNVNADFMTHTLPLVGYMVIVFSSVQVLDNVLFQPLIYSSSVKAHPMEIFLVIMAAGSLAGVIGMILAIPVYTIIRVFAAEFLSHVKLVQKITETLNQVPAEVESEEE